MRAIDQLTLPPRTSPTQRRYFTASSICRISSHLPREAVALAVVVSEVTHFAVFDIHSSFSHVVFGPPNAGLAAVGDDLRDDADVRSTIALVRARAIFGRIPGEHL